jgi:ATP-dependent Clp protease adaptor protein ClpS
MQQQQPFSFNNTSLSEVTARELVLYNDDVNSFDYVIESLVQVCEHTWEQAEQCALITHVKGKCQIKSGDEDYLLALKNELLSKHLTVKVE